MQLDILHHSQQESYERVEMTTTTTTTEPLDGNNMEQPLKVNSGTSPGPLPPAADATNDCSGGGLLAHCSGDPKERLLSPDDDQEAAVECGSVISSKRKGMMSLTIKWNGGLYPVSVYDGMTVAEFKQSIQTQTRVRTDKQKIINLKCKGKAASDDMLMSALALRPNMKVMMVGSLDEVLAEAAALPEEMPEVINDLDIPEDSLTSVHLRLDFCEKVQKRVKEYDMKVLHPMRPGKKLLVLDIDYTLFDHRSVGQNGLELMRPYLHEFLASAYQDYDLAIWSATSMKWIQEKMKLLAVAGNPNYKIVFYIDSMAMIRVEAPNYGVVEVKPLGVVWGKHSHYTARNTIMFDDLRRNFLMNPQNGLKIRPFRNAHENRDTDQELLKLAAYLKDISELEDLSRLRHSKWESYRRGGY